MQELAPRVGPPPPPLVGPSAAEEGDNVGLLSVRASTVDAQKRVGGSRECSTAAGCGSCPIGGNLPAPPQYTAPNGSTVYIKGGYEVVPSQVVSNGATVDINPFNAFEGTTIVQCGCDQAGWNTCICAAGCPVGTFCGSTFPGSSVTISCASGLLRGGYDGSPAYCWSEASASDNAGFGNEP